MTRQRVVVVTGGGAGIGAAIAEELGRRGDFVVTMDPLVTLDGTEQLPAPEETTAGRIVAGGGSARASAVSVTDADIVHDLFLGLVEEFGRIDAVVNVAGITRPTGFASGSEDDWRSVLEVHLDGYRNVLEAALPMMASAGHGRILGVTSGSGWRSADAGAYSCAKRAVASLTWELGRQAPSGVVVNAISPIAVTRMVTAALERMQAATGGSGGATGGLALGSMPDPGDLGPLGARLVADDFSWCTGRVIFAGGSEIALIDEPRLLEVVRSDAVASLAHVVDAVSTGALAPAEAHQGSGGGSNPRFPSVFAEPAGEFPPSPVRSCVIVTDRPDVKTAVTGALGARKVTGHVIEAGTVASGFGPPAEALDAAVQSVGLVDAVVLALATASSGLPTSGWERVLADHAGIVGAIHADAGWARAVADHAARVDRPIRLVTLTDATNAGGRSRAQASAQLARAARKPTGDRVAAFSVSVEAPGGPVGELAAHLVSSPDALALAGAELVSAGSWFGVRSHPRPSASISFGGPDLPDWFDDTLRTLVRQEA